MKDFEFNTKPGETVNRKLLILYGNTGTYAAPVWVPVGKRVEDSSAEYDWGEETKTDILGATYTTMKTPVITQSFDPCELDAADAYQTKLWNCGIKDQDAAALANQDLLIVHSYTGNADSGAFAERYPSSAVKPTGLGGEGGGSVDMPIDVTFGGKREIGTAKVVDGAVTFTKDTGDGSATE